MQKEFTTVGRHLIADFWGVSSALLDDRKAMRDALLNAAQQADMTVLGVQEHKFEPHGYTCLLLLAESHLSAHTYPEHGYVALDVFTCGGGHPDKALSYLQERLDPSSHRIVDVERGQPPTAQRAAVARTHAPALGVPSTAEVAG